MYHISVTWHFRRCKLFFFWIPSVRRTICCHFHENRCYFIFSTLYNLNIYLWPLKPHNFKSMCRISKIITFLESLRQAGWFDLFESDIQALLIFDPLITLWGNFDAPYLKLLNDARVASACFYVRTCRRVRNSKKIATIRDFHLPGSFLCLSTRLYIRVEIMGCRLGMGVIKENGREGLVKSHYFYFAHFLNIWQDMCFKTCYEDENHHFLSYSAKKSAKIPCFYDFFSEKKMFANFTYYFQCIQISKGALTLWRHSYIIWSSMVLILVSMERGTPYLYTGSKYTCIRRSEDVLQKIPQEDEG